MHKLSDYAGKKVILYFYPRDNTPGCYETGLWFLKRYSSLQKVGSSGSKQKLRCFHKKFEEKYGLAFTLLSDTERKVIETAVDVWKEKKNYGKVSMGVVRPPTSLTKKESS